MLIAVARAHETSIPEKLQRTARWQDTDQYFLTGLWHSDCVHASISVVSAIPVREGPM